MKEAALVLPLRRFRLIYVWPHGNAAAWFGFSAGLSLNSASTESDRYRVKVGELLEFGPVDCAGLARSPSTRAFV